MFYFVVRHFRWLAKIPWLPQIFDSFLLINTWIFRRDCFVAIERLETECISRRGLQLKTHRFGGIEFLDEQRRELGHLHGHGLLDVLLTNEIAEILRSSGRVRPHHVFPRSRWISFQLESYRDIPFAMELLEMANASRNGVLDETNFAA